MPARDAWFDLLPYKSDELIIHGHAYRYLDEGEGDPILMSHGNPTWSFYWRRLVESFRETHRTVAVDHLGCGRSDKPEKYPYRLCDHVGNLVRLVEALDLQNVTLVGHDWGGAIGLGAVLERPDRFSRIVLLNTGAFPPPYVPLRIRACRIPLLGTLGVRGFNLFAQAALRMAVERRTSLDAKARAGLIAPYDNWANRVAIDSFVRDIPLTRAHPTWETLERIEVALPKLSQKQIALVWGMRDWCFRPECLDRLLMAFPDADVTRLEQVGHYVMEEAPDDVIGALRRLFDAGSDKQKESTSGDEVARDEAGPDEAGGEANADPAA